MTDTSRPTGEALIAHLTDAEPDREGFIALPDSARDELAQVLGALLTERDELQTSRDGWAARMMEFAEAEQKIAELSFKQSPENLNAAPTDSSFVVRVVQGDAKLATNPTHPETEPFVDPKPFVRTYNGIGAVRVAEPRERFENGFGEIVVTQHKPRSRAVYDAEQANEPTSSDSGAS